MSTLPFRLLFSDIDGTLVNSDRLIDPITLEGINKYRRAGGLFTLATGRNYTQTHDLIHQLQIDIPIVLCDGAMLYDPLTDSETVLTHFRSDQLEHILRSCEQLGPGIHTYFSCFHSTTKQHKFYGIDDLPVIRQLSNRWFMDLTFVSSFEEIAEDAVFINAIIYVGDSRKEATFQQWCVTHQHEYHHTYFGYQFFEVAPKDCTKAFGIRNVSKQLHLGMDQVAAIGDHLNDVPMSSEVGLLAAMENAVDPLKKLAHVIVPSNDENGLAHFILNHLMRANKYSS